MKGKIVRTLGMLIALAITGLPVAAQTVIYVDQDATGANDGSSWGDAFVYLQDALASAQAGDEVWVAEGTYRPDQGVGLDPGDRTLAFEIEIPVSIYGGFAGTESSRAQRDWDAHPTVLSGDLLGNDPEGSFEVVGPNVDDNANNVVRISAPAGAIIPVLDGLAITAGRASSSPDSGAGVFIWPGSTAELRNLNVVKNMAGYSGGGIAAWGSVRLIHSVVKFNQAGVSEPQSRGFGGGLAVFYNASRVPGLPAAFISDVAFEQNEAAACGGGLWLRTTNVSPSDSSVAVIVRRSTVANNRSHTAGGGLCSFGSRDLEDQIVFASLLVKDNVSGEAGGAALYVEQSRVTAHNLLILNNEVLAPSAYGGTVAIIEQSSFDGAHLTVVGNQAPGPTRYRGGTTFFVSISDFALANSIVWGNDSSYETFWSDAGREVQVLASINQGGPPVGFDVSDILDSDPLFLGSDYGLAAFSPAIDAGRADLVPRDLADLDDDQDILEPLPLDYQGEPRAVGVAVDMGAQESSGPTSWIQDPPTIRSCIISAIRPNPVRQQARVDISLPENVGSIVLEILDVLGRVHAEVAVLAGTRVPVPIDAQGLAAGFYFVRVSGASSSPGCISTFIKH